MPLITGIGELVTCDGTGTGTAGDPPRRGPGRRGRPGRLDRPRGAGPRPPNARIDLEGRTLIPGFVDSHSHLVFAGDRAAEFAARMTGQPYDGGGIATTVDATRAAADDELRAPGRGSGRRAAGPGNHHRRDQERLRAERRATRCARCGSPREFTAETTFLGAHVVPPSGDDRRGYLDLVTGPMLDAAAPYARWIDVFCEPDSPHAFDGDEARHVLTAGRRAGLGLRVHGNQLGPGPASSSPSSWARPVSTTAPICPTPTSTRWPTRRHTVATLLPGVEFCTRSPYPDARAAARRRGRDRPGHRLQSRAPATPPRCRS